MNDRISLLASALLILFFIISGILDILDLLIVRVIIFTVFLAIIINLLIIKSKDEDEKNLPE